MKLVLLLLILSFVCISQIFALQVQVTTGLDVFGRQDILYPNVPYHEFGSSTSYKTAAEATYSLEVLLPLRNVLFPVHNMEIGFGTAYPTTRKLVYEYWSGDEDITYKFLPVFATFKCEIVAIDKINTNVEVLGHWGINVLESHNNGFYNDTKGTFYWAMGIGFIHDKFLIQALYQVNQASSMVDFFNTHDKIDIVDTHINVAVGVRL